LQPAKAIRKDILIIKIMLFCVFIVLKIDFILR
jgi:hypothetical protein